MDDIECVNVKRNELRMKNSEMNMKSVDDCINVKIRKRDSHADGISTIGTIVIQNVMLIMQLYVDIMHGAITIRQKVVVHNTMVGYVKYNFNGFHKHLDLSRVSDIYFKNKIDDVENFWFKIEQVYKKGIINELLIDRQRQKEKVRNKKEYLWYLQYKIDQFEEKEEDLSTRITNFECDIEYITRKLVRLIKMNKKLKLPMKMSEKEREEKIKENEMNDIMEMKDKYARLQRSSKIFNEQLAKTREDLKQLKDEGKTLTAEPEPQAPAPANNNTRHGFLTRKCIAIKGFFMKKFNRRN